MSETATCFHLSILTFFCSLNFQLCQRKREQAVGWQQVRYGVQESRHTRSGIGEPTDHFLHLFSERHVFHLPGIRQVCGHRVCRDLREERHQRGEGLHGDVHVHQVAHEESACWRQEGSRESQVWSVCEEGRWMLLSTGGMGWMDCLDLKPCV